MKNETDATFSHVYDVFASQNGHFSHLAENFKVIYPFKAKKVTFRERILQKVKNDLNFLHLAFVFPLFGEKRKIDHFHDEFYKKL